MDRIIFYGSRYGHAERAALMLAEKSGIPARSIREPGELEPCGAVIHVGSLYAGRVTGLAETLRRMRRSGTKELIVVTVGLADPREPGVKEHIAAAVQKQLPPELAGVPVLHLRGGIDYPALSPVHRAMMWAMYRRLLRRPPAERSASDRGMIETYGQKLEICDMPETERVAAAISTMGKGWQP